MPGGVPAKGIGKNKIEFFLRVRIQIAAAIVYCVMNARVTENVTAEINVLTQQVIDALHKLDNHDFLDAFHTLEKTGGDASTHADHEDALRTAGARAHQRAAFVG